ncbi:MAG: type II secretion system F family protein [Candidatus Gottesmanbacteria bacterium]
MAFFKYKAFTPDGKSATGLVEAASQDQAVKLLKEKQLFVVSLNQTQEKALSSVFTKMQKISFSDIVNFTRQLSTMVTAGLSIPDALGILKTQAANSMLSHVIGEIERNIIGGGNLGDALSKYPQYFSNIYISLVRAGEASGQLDKVLAQLADTLEGQREFRNKVVGALIYPVIIVVGMIAVVIIMMIVVMPRLTDLYKDFGIELPWSTKMLIGLSNFILYKWWLALAVIVGLIVLFRRWKKTEAGEYILDSLMFKIPLFGVLQQKLILVEFTRTLAMLIGSGIHILDALRILKGSLGNVLFRNAIDDIAKKVEKGFPLGDMFASHKEFPPIVSQMVKVGEETGKLDETLLKISKYFQVETEGMVKGLTTAIEPIIMVVLGVGVGFIVISVITPIYNLTAQFK